jgi:hypothetical protein
MRPTDAERDAAFTALKLRAQRIFSKQGVVVAITERDITRKATQMRHVSQGVNRT